MLSETIQNEIHHEAGLYEQKQAAAIEALKIVQKHHGWVDDASIKEIASLLDMSPTDLDSVATFYNLIRRQPVGRHVILLCTSVSCWILGYEKLRQHIGQTLGIDFGQTTPDNRFTLLPNQCLGACDRAPVLMIDNDTHRNVTPENLTEILSQYE